METILKEIFDRLPGCFLIIEANDEYRILDATDEYLRVAHRSREIIGRPLFETFPDSAANQNSGSKRLRQSFEKVLRTKRPDALGIQRYDTSTQVDGAFEISYWKPLNIPVPDDNGNVLYIIHSVINVTQQVLLNQQLKQRDENTQQQIADAITTTQEIERMEIGRELHDNINQLLITARLYLGQALTKAPVSFSLAEAAYGLIEKAIEEIKTISAALLNTSLQEENLIASLENLFSQVMSHGSMNIKKEIQLPDESLIETKTKVTIFRIVQEQFANIIKHAEAQNIHIALSFSDNTLTLVVKDDGKGFEISKRQHGLGFQNMKSRVAVMDGTIAINSAPGDGCTITVSIPFRQPK